MQRGIFQELAQLINDQQKSLAFAVGDDLGIRMNKSIDYLLVGRFGSDLEESVMRFPASV